MHLLQKETKMAVLQFSFDAVFTLKRKRNVLLKASNGNILPPFDVCDEKENKKHIFERQSRKKGESTLVAQPKVRKPSFDTLSKMSQRKVRSF